MLFFLFLFFHSQQHSECCSLLLHTHTPTPHTAPLTQHKKAQYDHGDPPTDHAIIHISPHTWAITLKPFLFPSQHPYAPSDASAASVPLPIARPQPTTDTDTRKFTISTSHDLVGFALKPFHLQFASNHFPSLSNNWGKYTLRFS